MDKLVERLGQNDSRYTPYPEDVEELKLFIEDGGVECKCISIEFNDCICSEETMQRLKSHGRSMIQPLEKKFIAYFLEQAGYLHISFEQSCGYSVCDVFGESTGILPRVLGEGGPCRFDKVIEALRSENTELWHLFLWEGGPCELWIYRRGKNWKDCILKYGFWKDRLKQDVLSSCTMFGLKNK
jgi:hypothetical protein